MVGPPPHADRAGQHQLGVAQSSCLERLGRVVEPLEPDRLAVADRPYVALVEEFFHLYICQMKVDNVPAYCMNGNGSVSSAGARSAWMTPGWPSTGRGGSSLRRIQTVYAQSRGCPHAPTVGGYSTVRRRNRRAGREEDYFDSPTASRADCTSAWPNPRTSMRVTFPLSNRTVTRMRSSIRASLPGIRREIRPRPTISPPRS